VSGTSTTSPSQIIDSAIADTISKLSTSLKKEGADIAYSVDEANSTINVSLIRNRIICEACIQPEKLVRTMLTSAIRTNAAASELKFKIETQGWSL
jgi:hypothetical protein